MALKHHFPSSLGTVLKALKGTISKAKSVFQSYNNDDKRLVFFINQQISIMVPENMVYGSPENVEESWSSTPPSGPRRVIQRSTANSVTEKRSAAAPAAANDEESDEEDETRLKRPRNLPWPPRSVSTEASNDETPAGHFLYPLVAVDCITDWSTAPPTETEITTKAEKTQEVCHGHHHSRAVTTTAQHSGGPCSSTSQNLGSTVWR
jgi:hypothetical protein